MMPMRLCVLGSFYACVFVSVCAVNARADDALEELKTGYALKQAGRCAEAIAHFTRSFQLDHKPKAVLNLADCEAQTADLVDAHAHATQGLELATQMQDATLQSVATDQLSAIAKRLPRLKIVLAAEAPSGCAVTLDGRPIDPASLGVETGVNPGAHHLVASAAGFADRSFDVNLHEGTHLSVEVQPGPRPASSPPVGPGASETEPRATGTGAGGTGTLRALAFTSLGTGAVGVTLGIVFGLSALSKNSTLEGECSNRVCPQTLQSEVDSFNHARTASDVAYAVGFVGLGAGAALWLLSTSPKTQKAEAHLWLGPASAGVNGAF
jgi:hypothetical protein